MADWKVGGSVFGEAKPGGGITICLDLWTWTWTWREEKRQLFVGAVGDKLVWEDVVICKAALGGFGDKVGASGSPSQPGCSARVPRRGGFTYLYPDKVLQCPITKKTRYSGV